MTPDELCRAYREELRRLYGDKVADKSRISYRRGWFYILKAQTFRDGSCGPIGPSRAYRKRKVLEMLTWLQDQRPVPPHRIQRGGGDSGQERPQ